MTHIVRCGSNPTEGDIAPSDLVEKGTVDRDCWLRHLRRPPAPLARGKILVRTLSPASIAASV